MSMITLNVSGDVITGSYNGKNFGVAFDKKVYKKMLELQQKANEATSVKEVNKVLEKFEPLTVEDFKKTVQRITEAKTNDFTIPRLISLFTTLVSIPEKKAPGFTPRSLTPVMYPP